VLIAVVAAVGSLYFLGHAMTDFRYFLGLMAVAGLGCVGYRAYERAVERRAENARLARHADAENRAFMSGDSSGLYGQYPPVQPPDLPG
jgi:Na+/H+-translocating membrane pyrophosphatase